MGEDDEESQVLLGELKVGDLTSRTQARFQTSPFRVGFWCQFCTNCNNNITEYGKVKSSLSSLTASAR